jgi:hypothetical protein
MLKRFSLANIDQQPSPDVPGRFEYLHHVHTVVFVSIGGYYLMENDMYSKNVDWSAEMLRGERFITSACR